MPNVSNIVKTIQDIMRKDAGTYETADLFPFLLMKISKSGGNLFGEGVKTRIKEALLTEWSTPLSACPTASSTPTPAPATWTTSCPNMKKLLAQMAEIRAKLKAQLMDALSR